MTLPTLQKKNVARRHGEDASFQLMQGASTTDNHQFAEIMAVIHLG